MLLCSSPVTTIQLLGYGVAFGGVCWYNYLKYQVGVLKTGQEAYDERGGRIGAC